MVSVFPILGYRAFYVFTAFILYCRLNTRLVRNKGQIVYKERAYHVGKKYAGERVNLQVEGSLLKIYDGDELITVHPLKDQVEKRSLREYQALVGDAV